MVSYCTTSATADTANSHWVIHQNSPSLFIVKLDSFNDPGFGIATSERLNVQVKHFTTDMKKESCRRPIRSVCVGLNSEPGVRF
jgi:hypothetical protein